MDHDLPADVAQTRLYYQRNPQCDCSHCRNFRAQVKGHCRVLTRFLRDLGANAASPDEVLTGERKDGLVHCNACWTICSTAKANPQTIWLRDGDMHLELTIRDGFLMPNTQEGPYFSILVTGIQLPWALDEAF